MSTACEQNGSSRNIGRCLCLPFRCNGASDLEYIFSFIRTQCALVAKSFRFAVCCVESKNVNIFAVRAVCINGPHVMEYIYHQSSSSKKFVVLWQSHSLAMSVVSCDTVCLFIGNLRQLIITHIITIQSNLAQNLWLSIVAGNFSWGGGESNRFFRCFFLIAEEVSIQNLPMCPLPLPWLRYWL